MMTRSGHPALTGRAPTGAQAITDEVVQRFASTPDERLGFLLQKLTRHLHAFAIETGLTQAEWAAGVEFLTAVGQRCTPTRQEMILLSDTIGLSMVVDAIAHGGLPGTTESTVLGPFYVPDAPLRPMGSSIAEMDGSGEPAHVSGVLRDTEGRPVKGVLDIWQSAANGMYAVQDADQPSENLRGRFVTGPDGRYSFWSVRPTDYAIPDDGPVGAMLRATGRHPWRAAHLHLIVSAPGMTPVTTHLFDDESSYLDSDAVFGVKPSLICHFEAHGPGEPGGPPGWDGRWFSLERDIVLAPESV